MYSIKLPLPDRSIRPIKRLRLPQLGLPTDSSHQFFINLNPQSRLCRIRRKSLLDVKHRLIDQVAIQVNVVRLHIVVHSQRHLLDNKVRHRHGYLERCSQSDGSQGTVRRDSDVERLGYRRNAPGLGDAADVGDAWLQEVDGGIFERSLDFLSSIQALTECNWDCGVVGEMLDGFGVFAQ